MENGNKKNVLIEHKRLRQVGKRGYFVNIWKEKKNFITKTTNK